MATYFSARVSMASVSGRLFVRAGDALVSVSTFGGGEVVSVMMGWVRGVERLPPRPVPPACAGDALLFVVSFCVGEIMVVISGWVEPGVRRLPPRPVPIPTGGVRGIVIY